MSMESRSVRGEDRDAAEWFQSDRSRRRRMERWLGLRRRGDHGQKEMVGGTCGLVCSRQGKLRLMGDVLCRGLWTWWELRQIIGGYGDVCWLKAGQGGSMRWEVYSANQGGGLAVRRCCLGQGSGGKIVKRE